MGLIPGDNGPDQPTILTTVLQEKKESIALDLLYRPVRLAADAFYTSIPEMGRGLLPQAYQVFLNLMREYRFGPGREALLRQTTDECIQKITALQGSTLPESELAAALEQIRQDVLEKI
jgi:hypothetical protein